MKELMQAAWRLMRCEDGLAGVEYGLMATCIAVAVAAGTGTLGQGLATVFTNIGACFDTSGGGTCPFPLPPGVTL